MVRPYSFGFNEETAPTNRFQAKPSAVPRDRARSEFDRAVEALEAAGVRVLVVEDNPRDNLPDAVFPNNWISTHHDGTVVLYPMFARSRRRERRGDIVDRLRKDFTVRRVVDLSPNEDRGRFLEGTGSLVFDHPNGTVYASLSPRTDMGMILEVQALFGCEAVVFHATDEHGVDLYHTNVVLTIADDFAVVASEAIPDAKERRALLDRLRATGRRVLEITRAQMTDFAANALGLQSAGGRPVTALSERAWNAFTREQRETLSGLSRVVSVPIPTIESVGGGSVRCMLAEIFLPPLKV